MKPVQIVRSATLGGAAALPVDPIVNVAPVQRHAPPPQSREEPWDPWPETRIGYDAPAEASLLYPPREAMRRFESWLAAYHFEIRRNPRRF